MTLASDFLAVEKELADLFGATVSLVVPTQTYATDGTVTETTQQVSVAAEGPIDEAQRYRNDGTDTRVNATFYVPASGLTVTPTTASRIVLGGRTWQVYAVSAYTMQGTTTSWRLDCGEVPDA